MGRGWDLKMAIMKDYHTKLKVNKSDDDQRWNILPPEPAAVERSTTVGSHSIGTTFISFTSNSSVES